MSEIDWDAILREEMEYNTPTGVVIERVDPRAVERAKAWLASDPEIVRRIWPDGDAPPVKVFPCPPGVDLLWNEQGIRRTIPPTHPRLLVYIDPDEKQAVDYFGGRDDKKYRSDWTQGEASA